jgi:hypothetical protein
VEDTTNNYRQMTQDELLEHMKTLETHQLITSAMKLNPTQYMLELAKERAKIPSTFYVSTIMEPHLGSIPLTTFTPSFNTSLTPPFPNLDQTLGLPLSSYMSSQSLTTNKSSLFQALQIHPLVNN